MLPRADVNATLEAMTALSGGTGNGAAANPGGILNEEFDAGSRLARVDYGVVSERAAKIQTGVRCAYVRSADLANRFADASALNPGADTDIVDPTATRAGGIFSKAEYDGDGDALFSGQPKVCVNCHDNRESYSDWVYSFELPR